MLSGFVLRVFEDVESISEMFSIKNGSFNQKMPIVVLSVD